MPTPTTTRTPIARPARPTAARPPMRRDWRLPGVLAVVVIASWLVPAVRGQGLSGHWPLRVGHAYTVILAPLGWLASLAVTLAPARLRRPLALRTMAAFAAVLLALPVVDLAATAWSVRVGHIWYYAQCFPRSQNAHDPELVWKRTPGLTWRGRKTPFCDEVEYRTDQNGFRNPPGLRRADLVFVGDSVTEAGEVNESSTFVQKTAAALGLSAVNLGTSGYGPQQELAVLRRYGLAYQPRLVVWQVTEWNDLIDADAYRTRHGPAAHTLPPWSRLYSQHSPVVRFASMLLPGRLPNSLDFQRSDGRIDQQMFWPYEPDPHHRLPLAFTETQRSVATAYKTCRSRGIGFVVLYVPSHVRVLFPYLRFNDDAQRARFWPQDRSGGSDLSDALQAFCSRLGCPIIDMAPPLMRRADVDNRRVYIPNDPHLGIDGHDEVAQTLVEFVRSQPELTSPAVSLRP